MSLQDSVKEQALALPDGCGMRGVCPKCHKANAFSISRTCNELRFICFSASCGYKGCIDSKSGDTIRVDATHKQHKKLFSGKLRCLTKDEVEWLAKKFYIRRKFFELVRYGTDKRVYYPQFDITGRIQGYIARYYPELAGGKPLRGAKAYWKPVLPTEGGLNFPNMDVLEMARKQSRVVLVEDMPSALRIISQCNLPAVCLGGTNLYDSHIRTMEVLGIKDIAIVLDADAVVKAMKIKRLLSLSFPSTVCIPLTGADPKDMTVSELDITFRQLTVR